MEVLNGNEMTTVTVYKCFELRISSMIKVGHFLVGLAGPFGTLFTSD